MADKYYGTPEIREMEKMMSRFMIDFSLDITTAFNGLLDYIIGFFDPTSQPVEGWSFTNEQTAKYHEMMYQYFLTMDEQLKRKEWYDAWGDLFMALYAGGRKGQFFTPPSLVNMMTEGILYNLDDPTHSVPGFGLRHTISDPACGSARNLLAAHIKYMSIYDRKPFVSGEDIDVQCCKMSAINMAMHGCFGEVVCHDTLCEPKSVRYGYIVNETMYPFPTNVPSIRRCNDPQKFVCTSSWEFIEKRKEQQKPQQKAAEPKAEAPIEETKPKQPQQLTLW